MKTKEERDEFERTKEQLSSAIFTQQNENNDLKLKLSDLEIQLATERQAAETNYKSLQDTTRLKIDESLLEMKSKHNCKLEEIKRKYQQEEQHYDEIFQELTKIICSGNAEAQSPFDKIEIPRMVDEILKRKQQELENTIAKSNQFEEFCSDKIIELEAKDSEIICLRIIEAEHKECLKNRLDKEAKEDELTKKIKQLENEKLGEGERKALEDKYGEILAIQRLEADNEKKKVERELESLKKDYLLYKVQKRIYESY